jgi:hypothetical protein
VNVQKRSPKRMSEAGTEISLVLQPRFGDRSGNRGPLAIRLIVGMDIVWDMLPYPTARRSSVTHHAFEDYANRHGADPRVVRSLLVGDLSISLRPVSPLRIVPSRAPDRVGVDGFLGFDFFAQFQIVEWHPNTGFMRLRYP